MGVLKVRVNGVWEDVVSPAEPPLDEVWVGTASPDPASTYEVWYNTSTVPGSLFLKREDGSWEESGASEVEVGPTDPYVTRQDSRAEVWVDTSVGQGAKVKFRQPPGPGGTWRAMAEFTESEVEISPTAPSGPGGVPEAELWVNTSTTPPTLMGYVNGGWVQLTGPDPMVPQEVFIGPTDPQDAMTELWYDTTHSPKGTLYANNFGVWEAVGGAEEVFVGSSDPRTDPQSEVLLWQDTSRGAPGELMAWVGNQWQPVIRYGGVAYEQQYGQAPFEGTQLVAARADHTHGTPQPEVHVGSTDPYTYATPIQADLWYDTSTTP